MLAPSGGRSASGGLRVALAHNCSTHRLRACSAPRSFGSSRFHRDDPLKTADCSIQRSDVTGQFVKADVTTLLAMILIAQRTTVDICNSAYQSATVVKAKDAARLRLNIHRELKSAKLGDKIPLEYALAMMGEQPATNARKLTKDALQDWHVHGTSPSIEALPEALYALFEKTNSSTIGGLMMDLQLDGGPGDTLMELHVDLMKKHPNFVAGWLRKTYGSADAAVWHKKFRKYDSFTMDLYTEISDKKSYRSLLARARAMKSTNGRFLVRYLTRLPHATP